MNAVAGQPDGQLVHHVLGHLRSPGIGELGNLSGEPIAGLGHRVAHRDDRLDIRGTAERGEYLRPARHPLVDHGLIDRASALGPAAQHHRVHVPVGHVDHAEPVPGRVRGLVQLRRGQQARQLAGTQPGKRPGSVDVLPPHLGSQPLKHENPSLVTRLALETDRHRSQHQQFDHGHYRARHEPGENDREHRDNDRTEAGDRHAPPETPQAFVAGAGPHAVGPLHRTRRRGRHRGTALLEPAPEGGGVDGGLLPLSTA